MIGEPLIIGREFIGTAALVFIAAHLLWPPQARIEGTQISRSEVTQYAYVASKIREVFHKPS